MVRFLSLVAVLLVLSCKDAPKEEEPFAPPPLSQLSIGPMPQKLEADPVARQLLDGWAEYREYEKSIEILKKSRSKEDVEFATNDLFEQINTLYKSRFPESFNLAQVKSRIKIVQTFNLKARGAVKSEEDPKQALVQLIEANNSLTKQFNLVVKDSLDPSLILDP